VHDIRPRVCAYIFFILQRGDYGSATSADQLKNRKAGFGYFMDDAFLSDYQFEKGKRYSRETKISIVREIAEMAESHPTIFSSYSGEAVVPCFASHNTRFIDKGPIALDELESFKGLFAIEADSQWYEVGVYIVCVSFCRIAYMHIQRNVTQSVTF
jgi:hypothetical protein